MGVTPTVDHAVTAAHATTAGHSTNASHAVNANHATTAGHATTADRAANVDHAATAGSAATAEIAEVAGIAENANPMAYAYVTNDGHIDGPRSSGGIRYNGGGTSGDYCFSAPRPKGIQVTADCTGGICGYPIPYPVVVAGLGQGENCPAGTEFYVRAFNSTNGQRARVAFFLSLVL